MTYNRTQYAVDKERGVFRVMGICFENSADDNKIKEVLSEISYMDVYHDDDRASLLRVLGRASCQPEAGEAEVIPGDAFLLCSDGFWEFVYNEEMQADLLKAETPAQWVRLMLLRHIRRTPPGNDNFSAIAVFVEEEHV